MSWKNVIKDAASKVAPAVEGAARSVVPVVRGAADAVIPAVKGAAGAAVPTAKAAAEKAVPAVKEVAVDAIEAAVGAAMRSGGKRGVAAAAAKGAAKRAAANVAKAAAESATEAAVKNAANMEEADSRPHTVHNVRTDQDVVVEAYVKGPDGSRDYAAVYPKGAMGDFGPIGNKAVGVLLVMAGVPMLVLPGPGVAVMAAGLYFLSKDSKASKDAGGATPSQDRPDFLDHL